MRTILFVCTGNTCRSPMAEAIARPWLARGGLGEGAGEFFIASAGIAPTEGLPVSPGTVQALEQMGIEHEGSSKSLNAEMIRKADLVICMSREHIDTARGLVPGETGHLRKIVALDPEGDIEDPIGMGQGAYDALAERLQELIPRRLRELLSDETVSKQ